MKKFYWLPKLMRINLEQYEPEYNPCFTTTQTEFWRGYKYYNWFLFKDIKFKFNDFETRYKTVVFYKTIPKDVEVTFTYPCKI